MAALAVVLFCLCRPTLVVRAAVPQQNVVAVLLDDSKSMQIPDWNSQPRGEFLKEQFGGPGSPKGEGAVMRALSDRFLVRVFRFSSSAGRPSLTTPQHAYFLSSTETGTTSLALTVTGVSTSPVCSCQVTRV